MRTIAFACLLALAGCAGLPSAPAPDERWFDLEGEVREAGTNRLLPAARVEIAGATRVDGRTTTDAAGRFGITVFVRVPPVADEVAATRRELSPPTVILQVQAGTLCSDPRPVALRKGMDPLTVFVRPCS
jgi:hypothetical protein